MEGDCWAEGGEVDKESVIFEADWSDRPSYCAEHAVDSLVAFIEQSQADTTLDFAGLIEQALARYRQNSARRA